jgi:hypothetical protein
MKLTIWVPAAGFALMLTACAAAGPGPHAGPTGPAPHASSTGPMRSRAQGDQGEVVGSFMRVGGPLGAGGQQPPSIPLSGTLSFEAAHRRTIAVGIGKSGQFAVWLPAGTYRVSGRSPMLLEQLASGATVEPMCSHEVPVTVVTGRTAHVSVICAVP